MEGNSEISESSNECNSIVFVFLLFQSNGHMFCLKLFITCHNICNSHIMLGENFMQLLKVVLYPEIYAPASGIQVLQLTLLVVPQNVAQMLFKCFLKKSLQQLFQLVGLITPETIHYVNFILSSCYKCRSFCTG